MDCKLTVEDIKEAFDNLHPSVITSNLVQLNVPQINGRIFLKLENLQATGSFKVRGATNVLRVLMKDPKMKEKILKEGVYTASTGNFAKSLAWCCEEEDIPCVVLVREGACRNKMESLKTYRTCTIKMIPTDEWFNIVFIDHSYPDMAGVFIHPAINNNVIAGNGTIGFEVLSQLPSVSTVLIPYGGGDLFTGISMVIKNQPTPAPRCVSCEVSTTAPLQAALSAGHPVTCKYQPSWVDGLGTIQVAHEMWPQVFSLNDGNVLVELDEIAEAVRLLAKYNHVVVEGAGAASVAAALKVLRGEGGVEVPAGDIVCVVSGGCIDTDVFCSILQEKE